MQVIKQRRLKDLDISIDYDEDFLSITDYLYESIQIDKQGAKQLIEVLREFVNDSSVP